MISTVLVLVLMELLVVVTAVSVEDTAEVAELVEVTAEVVVLVEGRA